MKKIICAILAVMLCLSAAMPVFAAEDVFVPSIADKDHPEVVPGDGFIGTIRDEDGNVIDHVTEECLVITSVQEAIEGTTRIPEDAKDLLLSVYEQIDNGSMVLPFENSDCMVITDLIDVTFLCEEHPAMLEPEGVVLELTFDLGVKPGVDVTVMTYIDGVWVEIVSAVNNGDGTVTCVFEKVCPVAFAVPQCNLVDPPKTGDDLGLWIALLVVSSLGLAALIVTRRKASR